MVVKPLHLKKLSVGSESLETLRDWQATLLDMRGEVTHRTRMSPRRADEVLAGGSIFWIIKKAFCARQRILDLRAETDENGRSLCAIVLDPVLVPVQGWPHRPFQGWRYMEPEKAPPDLGPDGEIDPAMPPEMMRELKDLGLL